MIDKQTLLIGTYIEGKRVAITYAKQKKFGFLLVVAVLSIGKTFVPL